MYFKLIQLCTKALVLEATGKSGSPIYQVRGGTGEDNQLEDLQRDQVRSDYATNKFTALNIPGQRGLIRNNPGRKKGKIKECSNRNQGIWLEDTSHWAIWVSLASRKYLHKWWTPRPPVAWDLNKRDLLQWGYPQPDDKGHNLMQT